jgi:oligopeptide transport system substrate-binding protein
MFSKPRIISQQTVITLTGLFIVLIFASCHNAARKADRGPKYGGTLYINANDVPDVIFPGQVLKQSEQLIINQVYSGMVKYHPRTLDIVPDIAKNWLIEKQGTLYTFYIDNKARFHNDACFLNGQGRQIIAADIKYSIEQICRSHLINQNTISKSVKNISGSQAMLESVFPYDSASISGIEVINDTTLRITLLQPDEMFIHFLAGTNGLIFPHEAFQKYGFKSTVGSGAFKLVMPQTKGQPVVLLANENYHLLNKQHEKLPFIDTIVVSFIVSTSRELDLFSAGKLSAVFGLTDNYITPFLDQNINLFQSNPPTYVLKQVPGVTGKTSYNLLLSNLQNLELNPLGLFDFSEVYFQNPEPMAIVVE